MAEKHIEILDAVIQNKDYPAFIKAVFNEQRNNPATINKVKDTIARRLTLSTFDDAAKKTLQEARSALYDHMAGLYRGSEPVSTTIRRNALYEADFKANGDAADPNNPPDPHEKENA